MLLFEDRYIKLLGSALALGLGLTSIIIAIAAAGMPALETATGIDGNKLATAALTDKDAEIGSLPTETMPGNQVGQARQPQTAAASASSNHNATPNQTASSGSGAAPSRVSQGDIWLLAQVIHAEGRGESLQGQVAIGAVLLNRVGDSRFPNSLASVVYEPGAFCTVRDGQINLTPDATALEAARLAASGWDPTGGALYFYNPARTTSRWIYSRPVINHIGRHVFAA